MKHTTSILLVISTLFAASLALRAAPLASDALVYSAPATTASVTGTLAAGTVPPPVTSPLVVALPSGWQAVERADAQDCWVRDNDLDKELNVKPGTILHAAPNADSAAVTGTMAAGDLSDLRDIQGRWVKVRYTKRAIGYIQSPAATATEAAAAVVATATVTVTATAIAPAISPQTLAALTHPQTQPQPQTSQSQITTTTTATVVTTTATTGVRASTPPSVPRSFEGTFATARRVFSRSPYDYQLNDSAGERFAYLDLAKLSGSARYENCVGKTAIIYGTMLPVAGTKDIVIKVETLQLK